MGNRDAYLEWLRELLGSIGPVDFRSMFGGHGVYADGRRVGLVADQQLYLKVDDATKVEFAMAGSSPFVYDGKGKPVAMSYWLAPDEALDDADAMARWARHARDAAARAAVRPKAANSANKRHRSTPQTVTLFAHTRRILLPS